MTFTLADASVTQPTALGVMGGGEGFSGIHGIAVSLDTWQNTGDPAANFVGIATTNTPAQSLNYVSTNTTVPALEDTLHHFVVTTSALGIIVTMDGTQVLNYPTTPAAVRARRIHRRDRRIQRRPAGAERLHLHRLTGAGPHRHARSARPRARTPAAPPSPSRARTSSVPARSTSAAPRRLSRLISPTSITATSPAGTGTVDVTVTTGAGTSAANVNDQFAYVTGTAASAGGAHRDGRLPRFRDRPREATPSRSPGRTSRPHRR